MAAIFPSLISAHLLELKKEILLLEPYVAGYHLDVMDFHFVSNLTWGPDFINAIRKVTQKTLYVHLMVEYPEKYFNRLQLSQSDIVAVHYESPSEYSLQELIRLIKSHGWVPSIAFNPATPLDPVFLLKDHLENVLLMSVDPGFSGQQFKESTLSKLATLASWRQQHNLQFSICVDGGINTTNCSNLVRSGADQLALASAIFSHHDRIKAVRDILDKC